MDFWMGLWKVVLVLGVGGFFAMAVWVSIGGALDIRRLLKTLRESPQNPAAPQDATSREPR